MRACACLLLGLAWTAGCASGGTMQSAGPAERWNIITVIADDLADWAVSAYGNKEVRTPNMDRIGREGALFTNAYCDIPVCSASRASFLTGLYSSQVGIEDALLWELFENFLRRERYEAEMAKGLDPKWPTWPRVLQSHGYRTGLIGKWHLGEWMEFHPKNFGFDYFFGLRRPAGALNLMRPIIEENGKHTKYERFLPDVLTDGAIRFVERNRSNPFSLLVCYQAPHAPWRPVPDEDSAPLKDLVPTIPVEGGMKDDPGRELMRKWTRDYYGLIRALDRNLGRILDAVEKNGLADRTIVIFTSDHGYMFGHHRLVGKGNAYSYAGGVRGALRPNMFEESIRIPMMIRFPGKIKPGTRITRTVSLLDLFPTITDMLGVRPPAGHKLEGASFYPLVQGQDIPWDDTHFAQYDLRKCGHDSMRMIRTDRWKLVRHCFTPLRNELYDLKNDPKELKNLYRKAKTIPIRRELEDRLTAWQEAINDPVLTMPHYRP